MKKLTLSADDQVVREARRLAASHKTSISAMFARFVRILASRERAGDDIPADSIAAQATGSLRLPKGKTADDVLAEALMERHGSKK